MLHNLRFLSLQNAVYFIMLPCLFPVLFAFYLQGVLKFKCKIPAPKGYYYSLLVFLTLQPFFGCIFHSPVAGFRLLIRSFLITHNDAPQSIGLLWTSDQSVAETSTWQHATLTTDKHPCPRWDSNLNPSERAVVDLRLRPRGHWDRHFLL